MLHSSDYGFEGIADRRVLTVDSDATVADVCKKMANENVRNVFVIKGDKPIGVVRDIDIICKVVARGLFPQVVRVGEIMVSPPPMLDHKARVTQAARLMAETGVRRVLLMDGNKIVGSVTAGAVLSTLSYVPAGDVGINLRKLARE